MKKTIYIIGMAILLISCTEKKPVDYAILSGVIIDADAENIVLENTNDRSVKETIKLNSDGSFSDTLKLIDGTYFLKYKRNKPILYLKKGDNLKLEAHHNNIDSSLVITGVGAAESNFLLQRKRIETQVYGNENVFLLDEVNFKSKILEEKNKLETALEEASDLSEGFKHPQSYDIKAGYLLALTNYEPYHKYYSKNPDFKASEDLLNPLKDFDYTLGTIYQNSKAYKTLVSKYYKTKAKDMAVLDSSTPEKVLLIKNYGAIEDEFIKNDLLKSTLFGMTITNNLEAYYNAFKNASTNEADLKTAENYYKVLKPIEVGNPSPKFLNYENHKGGTTSLDDLKGKYVYIDVWATWCGPCKKEIPYLKELEKQYHRKNIHFLSISVDKESAYEKWKTMVSKENLGGVQLIADKAFGSEFIQAYLIKGIPKFILLDTEGKIVNANAPRPSDPKLIELINELNI